MNINLLLFGQTLFGFMLVIGLLSYYLGRRKTQTPVVAAVIGVLLSLIPPLGLVYLGMLLIKADVR